MTRHYWLSKLKAIIARVESGEVPSRVREIYAFGSFARGALEPNDLDLIVIHDAPAEELLDSFRAAVKNYSYDHLDQGYKAFSRFEAAMRKAFRRGSERIEVILAENLQVALGGLIKFPRAEVKLLWSEEDRDWEGKVGAISPEPTAGRFPRNHFMDVKRTAGSREDIETVTEWIDRGVLALERIRLDEVEPKLGPPYQGRLDYWLRCGAVGAESMKVLPWVLWWFQGQGVTEPFVWTRTEILDREGQFHAQVGRIYPYYVYILFCKKPGLLRQALIPHRRLRGENWMYLFERGPNWSESEAEHRHRH